MRHANDVNRSTRYADAARMQSVVRESAGHIGSRDGPQRPDEHGSGSSAKRIADGAVGDKASAEREGGGPLAGLMSLLRRFKAARRRRDDAQYGSTSWLDADSEITSLQREIFTLSVDDSPSNVYRYDPDEVDEDGPDHALGQSGGRSVH